MSESRTKNAFLNIIIAVLSQFLGQFSGFIVRTIFIRVLKAEYLGINGLFTNILQVLSLAELGVSSALIYSMYKPMATRDYETISTYMNLYKKIYRVIGCVVLLIGLSITPFLDYTISKRPDISESLEFIYILYVLRSASTYFFAYKQSLFQADQKNYVISRNTMYFTIARSIFEIIVLLVFNQFVIYLTVAVAFNYAQNIHIAVLANKKYPNVKNCANTKLDATLVKNLFKNIKAMFMHKVSAVVLNSSDNIILSKFIGLYEVGLYSNYSIILVLVRNCLYMIFDGIVPSVGNLCAVKDKTEVYKVFKLISYGNMWLTGFCSLCMYFGFNLFISVWAGDNYIMGIEVVFAIVVSFYIQTNMRAIDMFRSATGLFYNDRYVPIAQCLINLVISVTLVQSLGVAGIFIGTSIAMLTTVFWVQPVLVYTKLFKKNVSSYFGRYIKYTLIWIFSAIVVRFILSFINFTGIQLLVCTVLICITIPNLIFIGLTCKTEEFKSVLSRLRLILKLRRSEGKI